MISHVHVGIGDFDRAFAFYATVLDVLGLKLKFKEPDKGWAGWMSPGVAMTEASPNYPQVAVMR